MKKTPSKSKSSAKKKVQAAKKKVAIKVRSSTPASKKPLKTAKKAAKKTAAAKPLRQGKPVVDSSEREIRRMPESAYMNEIQLDFFRKRLLQQRAEVLARQAEVKDRLNQQESFADPADRATAEEEHWLDLRLRERESFLLRKIDESMRRMKDGEYGYCKVTGEPIGIPRLLARPTAEVCVDVKGQSEHIEAQYRDR